MHLFWWYQGLEPALQTASAIGPCTNSAFTNFADAQHVAVTVEGVKMAAPTRAADSARTATGYKGRYHRPKPPSTQSRPATTTYICFTSRGPPPTIGRCPNHPADMNPAMLNCMWSLGKEAAPIPEAIGKPISKRVPGKCWVKGYCSIKHCRWQDGPALQQYGEPFLQCLTASPKFKCSTTTSTSPAPIAITEC